MIASAVLPIKASAPVLPALLQSSRQIPACAALAQSPRCQHLPDNSPGSGHPRARSLRRSSSATPSCTRATGSMAAVRRNPS